MREEPLELGAGSLVLADLHLHPDKEPRLRAFLDWVGSLIAVPHLVILGDLFDVWVGPAQARQSASAEVLAALAGLSARGTQIEIVPGTATSCSTPPSSVARARGCGREACSPPRPPERPSS